MMQRLSDLVLSSYGCRCHAAGAVVFPRVIKREDGGPVVYQGLRVGHAGRPVGWSRWRAAPVHDGGVQALFSQLTRAWRETTRLAVVRWRRE